MGVTLRDVARRAGVSAATASRALDPAGAASSATRRRVQRAATDLGYTGNASARSLRTSRTDTIGLLIPDVRNSFFTDLAYAVDKSAIDAGLTVMIGNADEDGDAQDRYLRTLERHQIDGLLVVPQGGPSPVLRRVVAARPTVCLDRDAGLGTPVVLSDSTGGMSALIDHVAALGHRRVAIVSGPLATSTGRDRLRAARDRLADHGIPLQEDDVIQGDFRLASGMRAAHRLLDRAPLPDVVIAADALMTLGVLRVLHRGGVRPGRDIGVAAFDDDPWFEILDVPVTAVAQDTSALGRHAVEALVAQMAGRTVDTAPIPTRLMVRRSLGETGETAPETGTHSAHTDDNDTTDTKTKEVARG